MSLLLAGTVSMQLRTVSLNVFVVRYEGLLKLLSCSLLLTTSFGGFVKSTENAIPFLDVVTASGAASSSSYDAYGFCSDSYDVLRELFS